MIIQFAINMLYESDTVKVRLEKVDKLFFSNLHLTAEEEFDGLEKEEAIPLKEEFIKSYKRFLKHKIGLVRECDFHKYRINQWSYRVEFPPIKEGGEAIVLWFLESELYLV
jgi:hypothetical protein